MASLSQPFLILDRSPRSILELTGADRESFLQGMVSNDVVAIPDDETRHAALLDSTGHILADLYIHARPDALLIETDLACLAVLSATLNKLLIMEDVQIADVSDQWAVLSVYGAFSSTHLIGRRRYLFPTSFPILPGDDLWLPAAAKAAALRSFLDAGFVPLSAEEAEALRIDAGIPKWGSELSPSVLLPEAEMSDAVSYTKGCYVGQEIVARLHARGHTNRVLRRILLTEDAPVPPVGATLHVPEDGPEPGREIGRVTSAAESPSRGGQAIALGYVRKEYFAPGTAVAVQIAQPNGLMSSFAAEIL
jgi:folate-binding protein YgfZ